MEKDFKLLFDNGLVTFPIFVYDYKGESTINFYALEYSEDKLSLQPKESTIGVLQFTLKRISKALQTSIENGSYKPTDGDIKIDMQNLINNLSAAEWDQINGLYSIENLKDVTVFGDLSYFGDEHYTEYSDELPMLPPVQEVTTCKRKGVAYLEHGEILKRMKDMFGDRATNLKYEIYTPKNSPPGTLSIRYVSNDKPLSDFETTDMVDEKFSDFYNDDEDLSFEQEEPVWLKEAGSVLSDEESLF